MNSNIVRAWKDEFYRQSLSDEERAQLPENPVGELDLTEDELGSVFAAGGNHEPDSYDDRCVSFRGDCRTHFLGECVHPHVSYSLDRDDCNSYHRIFCHQVSYNDRYCKPSTDDRH